MSITDDATEMAVTKAIGKLMNDATPEWQEAHWDAVPADRQAALMACMRAKLLLAEFTRDMHFRYKLSPAGMVLREDFDAVCRAICDTADDPLAIRPWIRRAATPAPPAPAPAPAPAAAVPPVSTCSRANTVEFSADAEFHPDIVDLSRKLAGRGDRSMNDIAREFTGGDEGRAGSLLTSIRRYVRNGKITFSGS